jgi:serine/threonine protein kinase
VKATRSSGDLLAGTFRLGERLGAGGHAEVWSAVDLRSGLEVAVKMPLRGDEETLARLRREARAAAILRHPSVVRVRETLELEGGGVALVLERLVGETLSAELARTGRLSVPRAAGVLAPIAAALAEAHGHGIVHRDVNPTNVFLPQAPAEVAAKLLDFGATRLTATEGDAAASQAWTRPGATLGTLHYMAPEQALGDPVDGRADAWAFGVVLYEALSGRKPVDGGSTRQVYRVLLSGALPPLAAVAPDLPPALTALVDGLLEHDQARRTADMGAVAVALATLAERQPDAG